MPKEISGSVSLATVIELHGVSAWKKEKQWILLFVVTPTPRWTSIKEEITTFTHNALALPRTLLHFYR